MIKRTLYFGNPAYLSMKDRQLSVMLTESDSDSSKGQSKTIPIEDIGVIILDHPQITITHALMSVLLDHNIALISCDKYHLPTGLQLNLSCNTIQQERFEEQINASVPLKKQLWQQTIKAKIENQATVLSYEREMDVKCMQYWADQVKSGDSDNHEARAAAFYWQNIFPSEMEFRRRKDGEAPNHLFNYGYAILRSIIARALTGSGLLPTLGIFHRNRYNSYCLADDIMEPYRPYIDRIVLDLVREEGVHDGISKAQKIKLLSIPTIDVRIDDLNRPLLIAASITTASLQRCFEGSSRKILYPQL